MPTTQRIRSDIDALCIMCNGIIESIEDINKKICLLENFEYITHKKEYLEFKGLTEEEVLLLSRLKKR